MRPEPDHRLGAHCCRVRDERQTRPRRTRRGIITGLVATVVLSLGGATGWALDAEDPLKDPQRAADESDTLLTETPLPEDPVG